MKAAKKKTASVVQALRIFATAYLISVFAAFLIGGFYMIGAIVYRLKPILVIPYILFALSFVWMAFTQPTALEQPPNN